MLRPFSRSRFAPVLAALLFALVACAPTSAQEDADPDGSGVLHRHGGGVAIFRDLHVKANEVRRGDLVCIFGDVTIDGEVKGNVVVINGSLQVNGSVRGDVVAVLSSVRLDPSASLGHDLTVVLGGLVGDGEVRGELVHIPFPLVPNGWRSPFGMLGALVAWGALLCTALIFLFLLLFAAVAPRRVRVLSEEASVHYLRAWLTGIAGYVGALLVAGTLAATLLGIPIAVVFYLAFLVLKWLGIAGLCHRLGSSIGRGAGRELSLLGAILLGFLPYALLVLAPLFLGGIGFLFAVVVRLLFWVVVEIPAVGLVILTRAGARAVDRVSTPAPPVSPPAAR